MNSAALAAAETVRVMADQSQTVGQVYYLDASNNVKPLPIGVDPAKGAVYLSVFGTVWQSAKSVTATVGGQTVPVLWFGAQATSTSLDQVNLGPLPASLATLALPISRK